MNEYILTYRITIGLLLHVGRYLTCKISKNDICFHKSQKNVFLFFLGNESPNVHDSKFMIQFVPSVQQLDVWPPFQPQLFLHKM